jgi:hypothetical protein
LPEQTSFSALISDRCSAALAADKGAELWFHITPCGGNQNDSLGVKKHLLAAADAPFSENERAELERRRARAAFPF